MFIQSNMTVPLQEQRLGRKGRTWQKRVRSRSRRKRTGITGQNRETRRQQELSGVLFETWGQRFRHSVGVECGRCKREWGGIVEGTGKKKRGVRSGKRLYRNCSSPASRLRKKGFSPLRITWGRRNFKKKAKSGR